MKLSLIRLHKLQEVFEEIRDHYGPSKYIEDPAELSIYYDPSYPRMGEQCDEEISINMAKCPTMNHAIQVLIHEYTHYLQSPSWYTRYCDSYTYDNHPYEIQANEVAKRDVGLFI